MLDSEEGKKFFSEIVARTATDGRSILGFYDTLSNNEQKIVSLSNLGYDPSGVMKNPASEQMLVSLDK